MHGFDAHAAVRTGSRTALACSILTPLPAGSAGGQRAAVQGGQNGDPHALVRRPNRGRPGHARHGCVGVLPAPRGAWRCGAAGAWRPETAGPPWLGRSPRRPCPPAPSPAPDHIPLALRSPAAPAKIDLPAYVWAHPAGHEPRQLVMLGAGMDSRPWRMKLPAGARYVHVSVPQAAGSARALLIQMRTSVPEKMHADALRAPRLTPADPSSHVCLTKPPSCLALPSWPSMTTCIPPSPSADLHWFEVDRADVVQAKRKLLTQLAAEVGAAPALLGRLPARQALVGRGWQAKCGKAEACAVAAQLTVQAAGVAKCPCAGAAGCRGR